jgi:hypothetical protein
MYTWAIDRYTVDYCTSKLGVSRSVAFNWRDYFRKMCAPPSVPNNEEDDEEGEGEAIVKQDAEPLQGSLDGWLMKGE